MDFDIYCRNGMYIVSLLIRWQAAGIHPGGGGALSIYTGGGS